MNTDALASLLLSFVHQSVLDSEVLDSEDIGALVKAFVECWNMLFTDLHAAGYVLDPKFRKHKQHNIAEVRIAELWLETQIMLSIIVCWG